MCDIKHGDMRGGGVSQFLEKREKMYIKKKLYDHFEILPLMNRRSIFVLNPNSVHN